MAAIRIEPDVTELAQHVQGPVFAAGDAGLEEEAACFNAAVEHRPTFVVGATSVEDVQAAVRWATRSGVRVSVQATGHGAIAPVEGGVLISTRRMQDVHIDPHSRLATIGAGVKWRRVIDEAAPFGLTPLVGSTSDVGAIGYTLGGGLAVLGRTFGYASDWVVAFEVVLPDGETRRVTAEDGELFWALRGGKTNAVIVTSMTIELLPVAKIFGGAIYWDGQHADELLRAYADWSRTLPDEMTTAISVERLPDLPDVPEPLRARVTVHLAVGFVGAEADGAEILRPMREIAPAIIDYVGMMPVTEMDRVHNDPEHPVPFAYAGDAVADLTPDVIDTLIAQAGPDADCPLLKIELRHLGGAMERQPADDAVGLRTDGFLLFYLGALMPEIAAIVPGSIERLRSALSPFVTGASFVNLHGAVTGSDDQRRAWSPHTADRLRAVKDRFDPDGRFAFGHWA